MGSGARSDLTVLNDCDRASFVLLLGPIFEHSPWVAERCFASRPFQDAGGLHAAMMRVVETATRDEQLEFLRRHPELAGGEAVAGTMTEASMGEQGRLGLTRLSKEEFQRFTALNRAYREKFDFPCIVALRLHQSRTSVLDEMERRLNGTADKERAVAIAQIAHITRGRLTNLLGGT